MGLDWDDEPLLQSSRLPVLVAAAELLISKGHAYPCTCTRSDVLAALSAPHLSDQNQLYPGTCRGRFSSLAEAQVDGGCMPSIRFICPAGEITVEDRLAGPVAVNPAKEFGDFLISNREGRPAYHLAVVLDDHHQGVTEVLRGEDLLASCGPQALLQEKLGISRPEWIHVPLVTNKEGERLAKRSDGVSLRSLRAAGVEPTRLVQWLLNESGFTHPAPITPQEALRGYELSLLNPKPVKVPDQIHGLLGGEKLP